MASDTARKLLRYLRHEAQGGGTEFIFDAVLWKSGIVAHEKTRAGQQASELWPFGFDEAKQAIKQLAQREKISLIETQAGEIKEIKLEEEISRKKSITITINATAISIMALIIAIFALVVALT